MGLRIRGGGTERSSYTPGARKDLVLGDTMDLEARCSAAFAAEGDYLVELVTYQRPVLVLPRMKVILACGQQIELRVQPRFDGVARGAHPQLASAFDDLVADSGCRRRVVGAAELEDPDVARQG